MLIIALLLLSFVSALPINVFQPIVTVCVLSSIYGFQPRLASSDYLHKSLFSSVKSVSVSQHSNILSTPFPQILNRDINIISPWEKLTKFTPERLSDIAQGTAKTYRTESLTSNFNGHEFDEIKRYSLDHHSSELHNIGHVDINDKSNVIEIHLRGTLLLDEFMVDLDFGKKDFDCISPVHQGFLKLSRKVYPKLIEIINQHYNDQSALENVEVIFSGQYL